MKTIFRKNRRWKGKPIEYGLQILFGLPYIPDEPQTICDFYKIRAKGTTYYSFWIISIIHIWWEW